MAPASVLVTGANRGVGLGLVQEFLKNHQTKHVIATCRDPHAAEELSNLNDPRLSIVKMDVTDDQSIEEACGQIDKIVGASGLNLLVNNAGVSIPYFLNQKPNRVAITKQLDINTASVLIVTQIFLPLLKRAVANSSASDLCVSKAAVINISSERGSIAQNTGGTSNIAYRFSKAAVNCMTKSLASDLAAENILVAAFHPGWVQTNMGGEKAPLTVDDAAAMLVSSMNALTKEHSGGFFDNDLTVIPF